jgi:hypothetical protein
MIYVSQDKRSYRLDRACINPKGRLAEGQRYHRKCLAGLSCSTDNASALSTARGPGHNNLGDILREAITSRRLIPCVFLPFNMFCHGLITIYDQMRPASILTSPRLAYPDSLPRLQTMFHG